MTESILHTNTPLKTNIMNLSHQDWEPVVFHKKIGNPTNKETVKQALRNGGNVDTLRKTGDHLSEAAKKRKLEADLYVPATEAAPDQKPLPKLSLEARQQMINARTEKKLTQVQLAQQMNVRPNLIQDMENGKVLEDKTLLQKVNRVLGTKLKV